MEPLDDFSNPPSRNEVIGGHICFIIALLLAAWFCLTSWIWIYFMNIFFSYPVGALAVIFCVAGQSYDPDRKRYGYILWALLFGLIVSLIMLFVMLALG